MNEEMKMYLDITRKSKSMDKEIKYAKASPQRLSLKFLKKQRQLQIS